MKKVTIFLVMIFCAFVHAQELPRIAVYVASGGDVGEHRAFSTMMLEAFVNSGRYTAVERADAFTQQIDNEQARQRSGAVDDAQISRLGRQSGVDFICVVDVIPALGEFQLSARLIDVESARVTGIASTESRLENLASLRSAANELSEKLLGTAPTQTPTTSITQTIPTTPTPPVAVSELEPIQQPAPTPAPVHTPTVRTEVPREEKIVDHFFALRWMPLITEGVDSWWAFNFEYGQIRKSGWWWSIDGGLGWATSDTMLVSRRDGDENSRTNENSDIYGLSFNIGAIHSFANNTHIAYGGSVGTWLQTTLTVGEIEFVDLGFVGPIVSLRWQSLEVTYRGLIGYRRDYSNSLPKVPENGVAYINQLMLGFHFSTNRRGR